MKTGQKIQRYTPPTTGASFSQPGQRSITRARMEKASKGRWLRCQDVKTQEKLLLAKLKEVAQDIREDIKLIASTGDWPETVEYLLQRAKTLETLSLENVKK